MDNVYSRPYSYKGKIFYIRVTKTVKGWFGEALTETKERVPNIEVSFSEQVTNEGISKGVIGSPIEEIVKIVSESIQIYVDKLFLRGQLEYGTLRDKVFSSEQKILTTFEEFEREVDGIKKVIMLEYWRSKFHDPILFRGHFDASWELESTLERVIDLPMRISEYYHMIFRKYKELEACTGRKWMLEERDFEELPFRNIPMYEFMVYLRHYSFPSPLLDWTASPYIAAFFAFQNIQKLAPAPDKRAAIFVLIQKDDGEDRAETIETLGPTISADKRHHVQQCWYTICVKKEEKDGFQSYVPHPDFIHSPIRGGRVILKKFILPFTERNKALNRLEIMNINPYSLFGSEDSLMQHLATKSFILG